MSKITAEHLARSAYVNIRQRGSWRPWAQRFGSLLDGN
jgi:hypothetical protein